MSRRAVVAMMLLAGMLVMSAGHASAARHGDGASKVGVELWFTGVPAKNTAAQMAPVRYALHQFTNVSLVQIKNVKEIVVPNRTPAQFKMDFTIVGFPNLKSATTFAATYLKPAGAVTSLGAKLSKLPALQGDTLINIIATPQVL